MEPLDAVILAGGRSERLRGLVPAYHKPFLVVNGQSLLLSAIQNVADQRALRIVVVTAPQIAQPVADLVSTLSPRVRGQVVITLSSTGVGPALWDGASLCESDRLLVLMADNVISTEDVGAVCRYEYGVGTRLVPTLDAYRYTRWIRGRWVEDDVSAVNDDLTQVWCGPLVLSRTHVLRHSDMSPGGKIGPHLDALAPNGELIRVPVECYDVGTPEELKKMTGGAR